MRLYTLEEMQTLNPPGFKVYFIPRSEQTHPPISHRREFSAREAMVFSAITDEIRRANPAQIGLRCWAIGSRINGRWRTREQSEMFAAEGYPLKYSDWDVATNAKKFPTRQAISQALSQYGEAGHVTAYKKRPQTAVPLDVQGVIWSAVIGSVIGGWWSRIARWFSKPKT
jgi:hypothetical protein